MTERKNPEELLRLTTDIVSAHVSNNTVSITDVSGLIQHVYATISKLHKTGAVAGERPVPAVSVKKSVMPDFLICLEDGKKLQMLKRHLNTVYGMTLEQYKERWGLPADYPVVSPSYARRRSQIAKNTGLGINGRRKKLKVFVAQNNQDGQSQVAVMATGTKG